MGVDNYFKVFVRVPKDSTSDLNRNGRTTVFGRVDASHFNGHLFFFDSLDVGSIERAATARDALTESLAEMRPQVSVWAHGERWGCAQVGVGPQSKYLPGGRDR